MTVTEYTRIYRDSSAVLFSRQPKVSYFFGEIHILFGSGSHSFEHEYTGILGLPRAVALLYFCQGYTEQGADIQKSPNDQCSHPAITKASMNANSLDVAKYFGAHFSHQVHERYKYTSAGGGFNQSFLFICRFDHRLAALP